MIHTGDCVDVMATMDAASVDAIVTDPPYGLEFMGKEWDRLTRNSMRPSSEADRVYRERNDDSSDPKSWLRDRPDIGGSQKYRHEMQQWHQQWATEALRVAKPGAYLLAFGGTRTYHRLACAIEDAGWIIRDCLVWAYAQGFPKGRANLKPAWEPIVMARKPGPLRPLAIDECRIGVDGGTTRIDGSNAGKARNVLHGGNFGVGDIAAGRWPANVILTDPIFDGDVDGVVGGGETASGSRNGTYSGGGYHGDWPDVSAPIDGDTGTYSRFFLIPKSARSDREPNAYGRLVGGLEEQEEPRVESAHSTVCANCGKQRVNVPGAACKCEEPVWTRKPQTKRANVHPTVKPLELMRHLVRLVTPVGGVVLDPFLGSGSTAIAAEQEGFAWVGIEREAEYVAIAEARLAGTQRGLGLDVDAPVKTRTTPPDSKMPAPRFQANDVSKGWRGGWASDRADFKRQELERIKDLAQTDDVE